MSPPLEAVIMKHVGAPALAAAFTGIVLGGTCVVGVAFIGYGVLSGLTRWMSEGAAAMVIGAALFAGALVVALRKSSAGPEKSSQDLVQPKPNSASALISSNLSELARTVMIGLSARRPVAMLATAAFLGAALFVMSESDKDSKTAQRRTPG